MIIENQHPQFKVKTDGYLTVEKMTRGDRVRERAEEIIRERKIRENMQAGKPMSYYNRDEFGREPIKVLIIDILPNGRVVIKRVDEGRFLNGSKTAPTRKVNPISVFNIVESEMQVDSSENRVIAESAVKNTDDAS